VNTNGDLLSLDTSGAATRRGTGFGAPWSLVFGPDDALYVSEFNSDLIWRIAPPTARPRLTATLDGASARLAWIGSTNQTCQLQSTTNLPAITWDNEGEAFVGTGGLSSATIPIDLAPRKFFRLQISTD